MSKSLTIECSVHFHRRDRGRKQLHQGAAPAQPAVEPGRVPRVARLMALAIRFDGLLRSGEVATYSEVARLGQVTHARISQIMCLLYLAPDIQEEILCLPRTQRGRAPVILRDLLPIAAVPDWKKQRQLWQPLAHPALLRV
jgi:hypothetical protein